jgi:aminoglycoside phosphotransferase (APT) family kinase protein
MTDQPDPVAILAELGVDEPVKLTRISGGWDTSLWRVDMPDRTRALRVFRPEQARTCRKEALVMRALRELSPGLPVPRVYAEGCGRERPALLLEWCGGRTMLEEIRQSPWRIWQLGTAMGRVHAQIHSVGVADQMAEELPVQFGDGPRSILHLDFHPLNVMTDGHSVTGVLDWANVAIGDRRADLARTITLLRLAPTPPGTSVLVRAMRALLEMAWRSGYRAYQPTDPFTDMTPFYVWAGTWMERDLRPKLGRPGVWLTERDLARIQRWTTAQAARQR